MKKVTNKELAGLWCIVDNEGFGNYMLNGPDLNLIERLGFNKEEVSVAIELLLKIDDKIREGEEYVTDED